MIIQKEGHIMPSRKRKTADFTPEGIESLAQDKPVVYKLVDSTGTNIYTGVAKRGRVKDRLLEHLASGPDPIPGVARVRIEQKSRIDEARKSEARIIKRSKPRYNTQGE